jgi:PIN domain nuclease of toxin-antitoxin system
MRLLLDTHVMLWLLEGSARLPRSTRQAVSRAEDVYVSAVSIWEISIKRALGRLQLPVDYLTYVERARFRPLSITFRHAEAVGALPKLHSDPFDRMLVAQAKTDALTLVTANRQLKEYGAPVLPAM